MNIFFIQIKRYIVQQFSWKNLRALFRIESFSSLLLLALGMSFLLSPFLFGFPQGHDWKYGVARTAEYLHALQDGQFPPFWASNFYGGYGSPIFLFYAPLSSFVSSMISWGTGSVFLGERYSVLLFTVVGIISTFSMAHILWRKKGEHHKSVARVVCVAFLLSPYVVTDAFLRNANAEYAALCLLPIAFSGLFLLPENSKKGMLLLAIGLAAVILTHNISALALLLLLCLGMGMLLWQYQHERRKMLLSFCVGVTLALLISAFYWLPAFTLLSDVRPENLTSGNLVFSRHFLSFSDFVGYQSFFSLGTLFLLLVVMSVLFFFLQRHQEEKNHQKIFTILLILSIPLIFFQFSISTFFWEHVPLLSFFQFPWRFAGPLSLVFAILIGLGYASFSKRLLPVQRILAELTIITILLLNAIPRMVFIASMETDYQQAVEALLSPVGIRENFPSATAGDEFLPHVANEEIWKSGSRYGLLATKIPGVTVRFFGTRSVEVDAETSTSVPLAIWAFPVWKIFVDGEEVVVKQNERGSLDVFLPEGHHVISASLHPPRVRQWGILLSIFGILLFVILLRKKGIRF